MVAAPPSPFEIPARSGAAQSSDRRSGSAPGRPHNCEITAGMMAHWHGMGTLGGSPARRNRESQQAVEGESRKGAPPDRPPGEARREGGGGRRLPGVVGLARPARSPSVSCCPAPPLLAALAWLAATRAVEPAGSGPVSLLSGAGVPEPGKATASGG